MSKNSEAVKTWRKNTKLKMIQCMGGKCQICGYNKCPESMDLHHLDPSIKELSFGSIMAKPKAWDSKIVPELKKCILLCANCHREYHAGYATIPVTYDTFDESRLSLDKSLMYDICPVCGGEKSKLHKTCSLRCSSISTGNIRKPIEFNDEEFLNMLSTGSTTKQLSIHFHCSVHTIRRKKLKLIGNALQVGVEPT